MRRLLSRLDHLCIEIISENVDYYSRIPKKSWKLRYTNGLGDRLILALITNSFNKNNVNQKSFEYVINNFYVNKLKIFPFLIKKIEHFDFLNEKFFHELEIKLQSEIKLKNENEIFKLTTNKLKLWNLIKQKNFLKSNKFFSNLIVNSEIQINIFNDYGDSMMEIEKLLLILLENTSKNIEIIEINCFDNPTKYFIEKLDEILKERKNLKNLNIYFKEIFLRGMPNFLLNTVINSMKINSLQNQKISNCDNVYIKSLNSIENLKITFEDAKISEKNLKEYFLYLKSLNFTDLKMLNIGLIDPRMSIKEINEFLESFHSLTNLKLEFIPNFMSLLPCIKHLCVLHIYFPELDEIPENDELKSFLSQSLLREIQFDFSTLTESYFFKIIKPLEVLKNTLVSLKISHGKLTGNPYRYFSNLLGKFNYLTCFHVNMDYIEEKNLLGIFNSLSLSSKTLQEISFWSTRGDEIYIKNYFQLFELLKKCETLKIIRLDFKTDDNKIPEFLSILKKFQTFLEKINVGYICNKEYEENYLDFFRGCERLTDISGYFSSGDGKSFMKSLYNSRYSIKFVDDVYITGVHRNFFPHIFMDGYFTA